MSEYTVVCERADSAGERRSADARAERERDSQWTQHGRHCCAHLVDVESRLDARARQQLVAVRQRKDLPKREQTGNTHG